MRALLPVVLLVLLASCGGGIERNSAPLPASDAAREAVLGSDAEAHCTAVHTERFVRDTYGSIEACQRVAHERNAALLAGARVTGAREGGGGSATARVTLADGGSGDLLLRRVGEGWKVDGYDHGLLHALGVYVTFEQLRMTASKPGLNEDGARACLTEQFDAMSDGGVRSYVHASVGARDEAAVDALETLIAACLTDPRSGRGGQSYFRPYFVQDAVAAARSQGYTDAELRCFERKLNAFTDDDIAEHLLRDKAEPPPATRRLGEALVTCDA